ncbi:glycosyltransferase family 2 protein [Paraglaciecola sp. 20A4]|uniref:glycosyltransferase family 2 protein n=1 Tax=Paraglaciecola sp. 20A4 TaxID=2687288 RepID=UPI001407A21A|nr:glycosyltransferase family 2 protein [Paraglaciecola sp. 20A4]
MELSVVIPAKNEAQNVAPLIHEIIKVLDGTVEFEIIYVDDGSDDRTINELYKIIDAGFDCIQPVRHKISVGQSTAIMSGVKAASGELIVTMDADGQNDPADIPNLLQAARKLTPGSDFCVAGYRRKRKDTAWKRFQSKVANSIRAWLLNDGTPDTGCGLKIIPKHTFMKLPYFDHMHRFIPALVKRINGQVIVLEVNHRDRQAGESKYNMLGRLRVGVVDIFGVLWLKRRVKIPEYLD